MRTKKLGLSFSHLSFGTLVRDASAHLPYDTQILLQGASGSGKSVLLGMLSGMLPLNKGTLCLDGRSLEEHTPYVWRDKIALVPQRVRFKDSSVLEALEAPYRYVHRKGQVFDLANVTPYLDILGLSNAFLDKKARYLSGGETQLVALMQRLQFTPSVLLLDEPTSALDNSRAQRVLETVNAFSCIHRCAIIWVSHSLEEMRRLKHQGAVTWQMNAGILEQVQDA